MYGSLYGLCTQSGVARQERGILGEVTRISSPKWIDGSMDQVFQHFSTPQEIPRVQEMCDFFFTFSCQFSQMRTMVLEYLPTFG